MEKLEFQSRDSLTPPQELLAEHRTSTQHLFATGRFYSRAMEADRERHSRGGLVSFADRVRRSFYPSDGQSPDFPLLSGDLFSIFIALLYWHPTPPTLEEFDEISRLFILANGLQASTQKNASSNTAGYPNLGPQHDALQEILSQLSSNLNGADRLKQFAFLRKVYILRNTLFDVFYSELPDGSGAAPFLELCNILLNTQLSEKEAQETSPFPPLEKAKILLNHWKGGLGHSLPIERFHSYQFITLPEVFDFLYQDSYSQPCPLCTLKGMRTLLCLQCGELLSQCQTCGSEPERRGVSELLSS